MSLTEFNATTAALAIGEVRNWEHFARKYLGMSDGELDEIKEPFEDDIASFKMAVISAWMNHQDHTIPVLKDLVRKYRVEAIRIWGASRQPSYPAAHGKGCALIIANSFSNSNPEHELELYGAQNDERLMKALWEDRLKCDLFRGQTHVNVTAKIMKNLLKGMAALEGKYDYVVVVITTHGGIFPDSVIKVSEAFEETRYEEDSGRRSDVNYEKFMESWEKVSEEKPTTEVFFGNDFVPVRERDMREYFYNTEENPVLLNKPKLFILDYCRGTTSDFGHKRKAAPKNIDLPGARVVGWRNRKRKFVKPAVAPILPCVSDILFVYATQPESPAIIEDSSWLITAVSNVFKEHFSSTDVISMLTMVNDEMKAKETADIVDNERTPIKAMSLFESSLVKKFYLTAPSAVLGAFGPE